MTDTPPETKPATATVASWFSKPNIAIALGVVAVMLAGAPYVVPGIQSIQVRQGLTNQPKILEDTIKKLDEVKAAEKQKAADIAIKANHEALYDDARDPVMGNPNGPITIVEFLDYNCAYCKLSTPQVEQLLAENKDVRVVVKEYPIIADSSRALASYALATKDSGRYAEVHHAFMASKFTTEAEVAQALTKLGFDAQDIAAKAKSEAVQDHINAVEKLGTQLEINGTPTFIVGGVVVNGADMNGLKAAIEAQRAKLAIK
ncbi:DsbA family protein [Asticcacaulis sp. ZE23SCel15]|uniref:DsbA family protein n=1 Tax=Asticcacaulis sp. ZE23SCel15 TaxID=3059027 RepID=UPI0026605116|nr:DsbA family protein [Asticcacaulis sp. ZE23SCel15]WKL56404.1 DsbA family protein [Asticcacaulis sp. ZE23SCel15]